MAIRPSRRDPQIDIPPHCAGRASGLGDKDRRPILRSRLDRPPYGDLAYGNDAIRHLPVGQIPPLDLLGEFIGPPRESELANTVVAVDNQ